MIATAMGKTHVIRSEYADSQDSAIGRPPTAMSVCSSRSGSVTALRARSSAA